LRQGVGLDVTPQDGMKGILQSERIWGRALDLMQPAPVTGTTETLNNDLHVVDLFIKSNV
jgi:hypothetical protein